MWGAHPVQNAPWPNFLQNELGTLGGGVLRGPLAFDLLSATRVPLRPRTRTRLFLAQGKPPPPCFLPSWGCGEDHALMHGFLFFLLLSST